jgi:hypothetical protein
MSKDQIGVRMLPEVALSDMQTMARSIAASKMFGVSTEDQALALMLLCQAEGIHPIMALRRYHIIEGKPAYRADALPGAFELEGAILWHERNETECAATFFRDKHKVDTAAIKRAKDRYSALLAGKPEAEFAALGEITIIRTMKDAVDKGIALSWNTEKGQYQTKKNWRQSPRQMLHARCLTEGVRAINPGLVAGIYTEDEVTDMVADDKLLPGETFTPTPTRNEIAERNVKQATVNATGESLSPTIADNVATNEYGPLEITEQNYGELKSHIGQANGNLLGNKIKDVHANVIEWLYNKWRNSLGPSATEQDFRLRKAIEFAMANKDKKAAMAADVTMDVPPVSKPTAAAAAAAKDLRGRIEDLVLTEDQAIKYLREQGLFASGWTKLEHATENILLYLSTPDGWNTFKKVVEADVKPGAAIGKPVAAKKPARKGRAKK